LQALGYGVQFQIDGDKSHYVELLVDGESKARHADLQHNKNFRQIPKLSQALVEAFQEAMKQ
jgi:hypothetical protein